MTTLEDAKTLLRDYGDDVLVAVNVVDSTPTVTPTRFLPRKRFDDIDGLLKEHGWRYIAKEDGGPKWVPKSVQQKSGEGKITQTKMVHDAIDLMEQALTKLREAGY